ncbi:MAG: fatty acid desaturase [Gammaproteobacteria bacterium]|jgi:fatty acid desaturase
MYSIPKPAEQTLPQAENLFKAVLFPTLIFVSFLLARLTAESLAFPAPHHLLLKWALLLALATFDSMLIIGMGILAHDAVHRVLFRNRFWNDFIGGLLSALALIPFYANRQFHLTHHGYAHQPGHDPEAAMHDRPFWIALTWGSIVALQEQYRFMFRNLAAGRRDTKRALRFLKDLALLAAAAGFYAGTLILSGASWLHTLLPILLVLPLVFGYRALSDHYGVPAVARKSLESEAIFESTDPGWDRSQRLVRHQISGWVILSPAWLEWLWSHVNYHEVHHKFPWLSHVHLKNAFEATRHQLPYLVARGYTRNLFRLMRLPYFSQRQDVAECLSVQREPRP